MPASRIQLTMFLPVGAARGVEAVRRVVDPVQHGLIAAHVTLCRDDELADLAGIEARLAELLVAPLVLTFGALESFDGHGLLLKCTGGGAAFQSLRERLLPPGGIRAPHAHVTLAHPRNPRAPGNVAGAASALRLPLRFTLGRVDVIVQESGGPWRRLRGVELAG